MKPCNTCAARQFNFLKSLSKKELEALKASSTSLKIKKGETLFFEDEELQQLFCIKDGACKFSKINNKGDEYITNLLGEGDLMGRRSILSQKGALVTATAITDTTLCCLPKDPLLESIQTNSNFCMDVLQGFISDTVDEIHKIDFYKNNLSVKKRLAGLLLYLLEKFGVDSQGWLKVSLKRQDMAKLLGTTSEYIISLLTGFKEKKYIISQKGKIKLTATIALKEMLTNS